MKRFELQNPFAVANFIIDIAIEKRQSCNEFETSKNHVLLARILFV